MADNTILNVGNGGDSIRTIEKSALKTQVFTLDVGGAGAESLLTGSIPVSGAVAHDAVDSGNPVKIGGLASSAAPTAVATGDRVNSWHDQFGRTVVSDLDPELNLAGGMTALRDRLFAQRYTVLADSIADGLASFWTATTTGSATASVSVGEGLLQTGATAGSIAQLVSHSPAYHPGQVHWLNSAIRFGDMGIAGTTLRVGACTVIGTTPQDGFFYELNGTTLNAVTVRDGVQTVVDSTLWSRVIPAPYAVATTFQQMELRWTANTAHFLVNNILRHSASGGASSLTGTLNFPIFVQVSNGAVASNRVLGLRNIGLGRFGTPPTVVSSTQAARTLFAVNFNSTTAAAADTLLTTLVVNRAGVATTGQTSIAVTAGKTLRITSVVLSCRSTSAAQPWAMLTLRMNPTGAATIASPVVLQVTASSASAGANSVASQDFNLGDSGLEILGTQQIALSFSNTVNTNVTALTLIGYEFTTFS